MVIIIVSLSCMYVPSMDQQVITCQVPKPLLLLRQTCFATRETLKDILYFSLLKICHHAPNDKQLQCWKVAHCVCKQYLFNGSYRILIHIVASFCQFYGDITCILEIIILLKLNIHVLELEVFIGHWR